MSLKEKVKAAQAVLDAYGRRDLGGILEQLHADVEWVPPIALAEGRAFHGHAGVRQWFADLLSTFENFTAGVEQHLEVGHRLLTLGHIRSHGRGSGVEILDEVGWLWTFRDGKISKMQTYLDHDAARKAAESRPWPA